MLLYCNTFTVTMNAEGSNTSTKRFTTAKRFGKPGGRQSVKCKRMGKKVVDGTHDNVRHDLSTPTCPEDELHAICADKMQHEESVSQNTWSVYI